MAIQVQNQQATSVPILNVLSQCGWSLALLDIEGAVPFFPLAENDPHDEKFLTTLAAKLNEAFPKTAGFIFVSHPSKAQSVGQYLACMKPTWENRSERERLLEFRFTERSTN